MQRSVTCFPGLEPPLLLSYHVQRQPAPYLEVETTLFKACIGSKYRPRLPEGVLFSPSCPEAIGILGHWGAEPWQESWPEPTPRRVRPS